MLDIQKLSIFQRVLLITDGTLTYLLEIYVGETLHTVKLHERLDMLHGAVEPLQANAGEKVVTREILLQGIESQRNFLYAESILIPARLDPDFLAQLTTSQQPLGKLWNAQKMEIFKETIDLFREPAGNLATYFDLSPQTTLLGRTYIVYHQRQPIMQITEKFPETYFTANQHVIIPSPNGLTNNTVSSGVIRGETERLH